MINEHDLVILTGELPSLGLKAGDVGTVVHVYRDAAAFEVEFTTMTGDTLGVETLRSDQLRRAGAHERSVPSRVITIPVLSRSSRTSPSPRGDPRAPLGCRRSCGSARTRRG